MRTSILRSAFLAGLVLSAACEPAAEAVPPNPLLGSWAMEETHWVSAADTFSIPSAQPGLILFTPLSYSIQWTPSEEARVPFVNLSAPTEDEAVAAFRSVVFNAGSYTHTDSTVSATAYIAKVPGFEGGQQFYRYRIEGNTLHLTMFDETYPDGSKPDWAGEWETRFVLSRVE